AETRDREEYTVIDFEVGRDIGFGGLKSRVTAGLRHAQLESTTRLEVDGIPDWVIPDEFAFFMPLTHHLLEARLDAAREFEGTGPVVGWDATKTLFGGEETGEFGVEWKLRAGILFGKQDTAFNGEASSTYYNGPKYGQQHRVPAGPADVFAAPETRSRSVTVPVADLSLGLAYEMRRLKVSAGYRWERYFDALDAGFYEQEDADRTIDGPYFKLAVGFGG
ncbi:MAG TPA: Lpg1974 family pore-forming outer membrane protein, partial [Caulobacteraceae bacterium]|nr:Lpg1974 family pore-forming outer membrane protein [Caulobacteraceae bacterium]